MPANLPQSRDRLSWAAPSGEPHLQLVGVAAAGQVLQQEGSEGPRDVVEGGQRAVQEHTALHQSQTHSQAGQPAGRQATVGARIQANTQL